MSLSEEISNRGSNRALQPIDVLLSGLDLGSFHGFCLVPTHHQLHESRQKEEEEEGSCNKDESRQTFDTITGSILPEVLEICILDPSPHGIIVRVSRPLWGLQVGDFGVWIIELHVDGALKVVLWTSCWLGIS